MPIGVWTSGQTWAAPQSIAVWDGENWIRSKKLKVWDGSAWALSWVHPVVNASLSLSKSSVSTSESYDVTLTTAQLNGFPENTAVTFRFTGYSLTMYPTEGSTSVTLTGASHAASGTYSWYADVVNMGGTNTFGPVSQSVATVGTTVTLTNPAWCLSTQSGSGGYASIAAATFTVTLSNPASAKWLSFQLSHAGGAWTEYKGWTNPTATSTHTMQFSTPGSWRARAIAVRTDDVYVYSAETTIYCYIKHLSMTLSPVSPVVGQQISMTAAHSGDALGQTTGAWGYMRTTDYVWHDNWQTGNPSFWNPPTADDAYFRWVETYADGSTIHSNAGHSVVTANEVLLASPDGTKHCHDVNAAIATAKSQGKVLRLTGTFYAYTNMYVPDNLYINATGAHFYLNSNSPAPGAGFDAGRWRNDDKGNAAGYGQAGGFTIDGGTYDGNGEGCMTFSHSPGYTIKNATFYRYCASSNTGHAIETNSSGGTDNVNGPYTVQILNNTFKGTDRGQRTNGNDGACHYDWNWSGPSGDSGAAAPLWSPGEPVSTATQVMCHNVLVQGNTFHRLQEDWGGLQNGGFALSCIEGHKSADQSVVDGTAYRHNHFLITGNVMHGAVGSRGTNPNKGAIHLYLVRSASVTSNTLYGGAQQRYITAENTTDAATCSASGNASANPALSGNDVIVVENT